LRTIALERTSALYHRRPRDRVLQGGS